MSGGRGAQAQDQHPSQGLSQGAAAGGAAQGALASSVQAASTLAGAIDQPPAFGTRFATQRRHITCPPSLTNAIATAAQVLTGGAARARSPPQGAAASAAARMSVTEAAEAAAAAIPPAAGGGRQVEQSLAVPSLASSPLAPAVDGGGSQPYESGAHAAGGLGTTTEGEGTLHMQGHAAPRREEGTSATLQRESTLLQSLHRELQQELHSLPVGVRDGAAVLALAFEPWTTAEALTQARAAVQAAYSSYMAYLSEGSPFRGYESVLRRIATRLVQERSQSSWPLVMRDEMTRARADAADDAQAQERVRLASEARAAEEEATRAHAEEARRWALERQAALKAASDAAELAELRLTIASMREAERVRLVQAEAAQLREREDEEAAAAEAADAAALAAAAEAEGAGEETTPSRAEILDAALRLDAGEFGRLLGELSPRTPSAIVPHAGATRVPIHDGPAPYVPSAHASVGTDLGRPGGADLPRVLHGLTSLGGRTHAGGTPLGAGRGVPALAGASGLGGASSSGGVGHGGPPMLSTTPPKPKYHNVGLCKGLTCDLVKSSRNFTMLWELRPTHEHELRTAPEQICARIQSITANDYPTYGAGRGLWLDDIVAHYIWYVCVGKSPAAAHAKVRQALALELIKHPAVVSAAKQRQISQIETLDDAEQGIIQLVHLVDKIFIPVSRVAGQAIPFPDSDWKEGITVTTYWLQMQDTRIKHNNSYHELIIFFLAGIRRVEEHEEQKGAGPENPSERWDLAAHLLQYINSLLPVTTSDTRYGETEMEAITLFLDTDRLYAKKPLPPAKQKRAAIAMPAMTIGSASQAGTGESVEHVSTEEMMKQLSLQQQRSDRQHQELLRAMAAQGAAGSGAPPLGSGAAGTQGASRATGGRARSQYPHHGGVKGFLNLPLIAQLGKVWPGKALDDVMFVMVCGSSETGKVDHDTCAHCPRHLPAITQTWTYSAFEAQNGGNAPRRFADPRTSPLKEGERLLKPNEVIEHFQPKCWDAWGDVWEWHAANPNDPDRDAMVKPLTSRQWTEFLRAAGK